MLATPYPLTAWPAAGFVLGTGLAFDLVTLVLLPAVLLESAVGTRKPPGAHAKEWCWLSRRSFSFHWALA